MTIQTVDQKIEQFRNRLDDLYNRIKSWVRDIDPDAILLNNQVSISEEQLGNYEAPSLVVKTSKRQTVKFIPRGCNIIAAAGLVDVYSPLGTEHLVYIEGQPTLIMTESVGGRPVSQSKHKLRMQTESGWSLVVDKQRGNIPLLDEKSFKELWSSISE